MARLNIPERYREGLASLRSISEEGVEEIRGILDRSSNLGTEPSEGQFSASIDPDAVITSIKATSPSISIQKFKEVMEAVISLYVVKAQRDISVEQFVDEVCDAMEHLEGEFRLLQSERRDFAGKLLTLLNANVFALVTKAYDLRTEDEHLFCHARILTDLRPVFGSLVDEGPQAMIVMHTLKIDFHDQGEFKQHREFHVSLDADDLRALREIIDRAEKKARTISSVLKNVRVFGVSKE